jgi:predicted kinase
VELVVFCGPPGSGKSSFYRYRFFETHVRVSLDMLRTRMRERALVEACVAARLPFVVDNTNPTAADRARYVAPAVAAGYEAVGYVFRSTPEEALAANALRPERQRLPVRSVLGAFARLEEPTREEGFTALHAVSMDGTGGFEVDDL